MATLPKRGDTKVEVIILSQLIINPTYEKMIPALTVKEYDSLNESIKNNGLWIPIVVNSDNVILDGHHRYRICKELGVKIKHAVRTFENKLLEKKFVIECNLKRRHLNDFQKSELGIPLQKINKELAKKRQGKRTDLTLVSSETNVEQSKSTQKTADDIGVKHGTFVRAKKVIELAPEELKEKLREGTKTITSAYNEINNKAKVKTQESIPLPKDKYQLIYCDPPWFYANFQNSYNTGKTAAQLYHVMSADDLKKLNIQSLAFNDSILLMWVTYPTLEQGLDLIKEWGFSYRTVAFTWVKKNKSGNGYFIGLGNYTRANAEICLLAVKGKGLAVKSKSISQIIVTPITKHSEKPIVIRDRIVELFGNVKRVELFARTKDVGWKSWGDEI